MDHDFFYIVIDTKYLKTAGITRCIRFCRMFTSYKQVIKYLSDVNDPQVYHVLTISKEEYLELEESKKCF